MSRIGKKVIAIPDKVNVQVNAEKVVTIEGPKGKLTRQLPGPISVEIKDAQVLVKRQSDSKIDKSLHGLIRSLLVNMIKGVTDGYTKELEIIGVGFKAQSQANKLNMLLGFSHPVIFPIPAGIQIQTPKPLQIVITGIDKELVGQVAAQIRDIYPPEPYKGKGIRYLGEYVKKKIGKSATK